MDVFHDINIFESYAGVSSKLSFQLSRFVSSLRNISGTKKFPSMKFIECYYIRSIKILQSTIFLVRKDKIAK